MHHALTIRVSVSIEASLKRGAFDVVLFHLIEPFPPFPRHNGHSIEEAALTASMLSVLTHLPWIDHLWVVTEDKQVASGIVAKLPPAVSKVGLRGWF